VSFDTGILFTVDYNCSNPCDSLQYAWQRLLDGGIYTKAADVGDIAGMGNGAAVAALGMLSTIATVSDNAGGTAEMAGMSHKIHGRTDALDAAGNTTAAMGKGFAIGLAALVSRALFGAFVCRVAISTVVVRTPTVFIGLIVVAMLPYWLSAMTMKRVGSAALEMVEEVYRQLNTIPRLMEGTTKPDYATCVKVSIDASVKEMIPPAGHAIQEMGVALPLARDLIQFPWDPGPHLQHRLGGKPSSKVGGMLGMVK
jgi:Na+/H+-translocating membrane pyrophosphatase